MPNPFPPRLRERAVMAYEAGEGSYDEIAERFGVGSRTLTRWVRRYREDDELEARPKRGGWRSPIVAKLLHRVVAAEPDASAQELTNAYNELAPTPVSRSAFLRALDREGYVFKKNAGVRRSKTAPTS